MSFGLTDIVRRVVVKCAVQTKVSKIFNNLVRCAKVSHLFTDTDTHMHIIISCRREDHKETSVPFLWQEVINHQTYGIVVRMVGGLT